MQVSLNHYFLRLTLSQIIEMIAQMTVAEKLALIDFLFKEIISSYPPLMRAGIKNRYQVIP